MTDISSETVPAPVNRRYILHSPLGEGGMGAVYRATDRLTGQQVALKRVLPPKPEREGSTLNNNIVDFRLALAQEFKVLASLRHPNIISVLDYGFDDTGMPYFTMELLEDAQTILEAGQEKSLTYKISLLTQMLQALAYLHRRRVIHRDLKPKNVLVTHDQVKVLDFGLSTGGDQPGDSVSTAGTLAYMAPEVMTGGALTEAADLYAVGVIGYELFAGRHPFQVEPISRLINDILYTIPNIEDVQVDVSLQEVLGRLLSKGHQERYATAVEVISAFTRAVDQPIPAETSAIRESYLQAARLVGRDTELRTLSDALEEALDGAGSAWLVAGESGVGKSRLVEELRTLALVKGALVLKGQAVSEGGNPNALWRPAVRWMLLLNEPDDSHLATLKVIEPDIAALLNRAVPDNPETDYKAAGARLESAVEAIFRQQNQPIMLMLEDLHWSKENLKILSRLTQVVSELPLLIVGTFRDDECPELPNLLPHMEVLKLHRLNDAGIAELSEAMLGQSGRQEQVLDLLQRETEGNVFFLVEVVRALAEETGNLDQIGMATLPAQVFAGGIQKIVQHRLQHIPEHYYPVLQAAAVYGRQLNLPLLRAMAPGIDMDHLLTVCSEAAVLDVQDDNWRFAHDKLREGVLHTLSVDELQTLHGKIAQSLEQLTPIQPEQVTALALHYNKAGNLAKEMHYTALAGKNALAQGAYRDALSWLERSLALISQPEASESQTSSSQLTKPVKEVYLKRQIAEAYLGLGDYPKAQRLYEENLVAFYVLNEQKGVADTYRSLGDVAAALNKYADAMAHYEASHAIYRSINSPTELITILNRMGDAAYELGDLNTAKSYYQESLVLARQAGDEWGLAGSMQNLGLVAYAENIREYTEIKKTFQSALERYRQDGQGPALLSAFQYFVTSLGNGNQELESLLEMLNDESQRFRKANNRWAEAITLRYTGILCAQRSDYVRGRKYLYAALRIAAESNEAALSLDILVEISQVLMKQGRKSRALELLALTLHQPNSDETTHDTAERLLFELGTELSPDVVSAGWEKGKTGEFQKVITDLLSDQAESS
ncbi:MAG: protein kinase [Anaerolineaceae bacterium]|nr:protein kinase [Anaerolineaceae bacterium]